MDQSRTRTADRSSKCIYPPAAAKHEHTHIHTHEKYTRQTKKKWAQQRQMSTKNIAHSRHSTQIARTSKYLAQRNKCRTTLSPHQPQVGTAESRASQRCHSKGYSGEIQSGTTHTKQKHTGSQQGELARSPAKLCKHAIGMYVRQNASSTCSSLRAHATCPVILVRSFAACERQATKGCRNGDTQEGRGPASTTTPSRTPDDPNNKTAMTRRGFRSAATSALHTRFTRQSDQLHARTAPARRDTSESRRQITSHKSTTTTLGCTTRASTAYTTAPDPSTTVRRANRRSTV